MGGHFPVSISKEADRSKTCKGPGSCRRKVSQGFRPSQASCDRSPSKAQSLAGLAEFYTLPRQQRQQLQQRQHGLADSADILEWCLSRVSWEIPQQEARQQILEHRRQCKACQQDSCLTMLWNGLGLSENGTQNKSKIIWETKNILGKRWWNSGLRGTLFRQTRMEYYAIESLRAFACWYMFNLCRKHVHFKILQAAWTLCISDVKNLKLWAYVQATQLVLAFQSGWNGESNHLSSTIKYHTCTIDTTTYYNHRQPWESCATFPWPLRTRYKPPDIRSSAFRRSRCLFRHHYLLCQLRGFSEIGVIWTSNSWKLIMLAGWPVWFWSFEEPLRLRPLFPVLFHIDRYCSNHVQRVPNGRRSGNSHSQPKAQARAGTAATTDSGTDARGGEHGA